MVDTDEEPLVAAQRELLEETGYEGEIELVTKTYVSGLSSAVRYACVAKNCKKVSEPQLDEEEYIEVETKTLEEFRKILRSGEMTDVNIGYLCLDHLGLL
jgi:ADP-ribose pyrophosphatase